MPRFISAVLASLLLVASTMPGLALQRRPTISDAESCTVDSVLGRSEWDCDGEICSCCYTDGCWICDGHATLGQGFGDCVWEGGARKGGASAPLGGTDGVLDPGTGSTGTRPGVTGPSATELSQ